MSISISSHQLIRQRAYEIFVERGATGRKGDAVSDWLEAEQEIRMHRIPVAARMRHFRRASVEAVWLSAVLAPSGTSADTSARDLFPNGPPHSGI